jgi:predicted regulator of Ras-like GTPase activity (Roadblock/LC7/MglB family)
MSADSALADLIEISSQVEGAVLLGADGSVVASTLDDARANALAGAARRLFDAAEEGEREGPGARPLTQLEASTLDGSIFVVRDGERLIAAITPPDPTVGLVFYDLKTCLRQTAAPPEPVPSEPGSKPTKVSRRLAAAEPPAEPAAETKEQPTQSAEEAAEKPKKPRRTRKQPDAAP